MHFTNRISIILVKHYSNLESVYQYQAESSLYNVAKAIFGISFFVAIVVVTSDKE